MTMHDNVGLRHVERCSPAVEGLVVVHDFIGHAFLAAKRLWP